MIINSKINIPAMPMCVVVTIPVMDVAGTTFISTWVATPTLPPNCQPVDGLPGAAIVPVYLPAAVPAGAVNVIVKD